MRRDNVEILMGHSRGIRDSYHKPTESELLNDYLKSVPLLTINYDVDKTTLKYQVAELTEKRNEDLAERDKKIEESSNEQKRLYKELSLQEALQAEINKNYESLRKEAVGLIQQMAMLNKKMDEVKRSS
jgi:hypothetical protein